MQWIKIYAGTATDPKFRLIARDAGVGTAEALGVWLMILEKASDAEGDASGFNSRLADIAFDLADGKADAVIAAMQDLGMLNGMKVTKWETRQSKTEGSKGYERVKRYREKHRHDNGDNGNDNAGDNASERNDNANPKPDNGDNALDNGDNGLRIDKKREDKIKNIKSPPISPQGESEGVEKAFPTNLLQSETPSSQVITEFQDKPGLEFLELRDFWDKEMRCEGPLAGFREYKMLKKTREQTGMSCWPGLGVIFSDVEQRKSAHIWNPGYEIGLGRYLTEKTWLAPVVPRASPTPAYKHAEPSAPTEFQKQMQERRILASALLAKRRANQENGHDAIHSLDATAREIAGRA